MTHCNPVYGERRAGSIGLPLPDVEAKIMDCDTLVEQPVGEASELWVRGPQVMRGCWNRPDETAVTLAGDGWLRTGDIARMDKDGYFTIIDRLIEFRPELPKTMVGKLQRRVLIEEERSKYA